MTDPYGKDSPSVDSKSDISVSGVGGIGVACSGSRELRTATYLQNR